MTVITKTCRVSGKEFIVTDEDQQFYEKMGVPLPTLCPEERMRRRLAFRNERNLYHRKCDLSGKELISNFSPDKPNKVYDQKTGGVINGMHFRMEWTLILPGLFLTNLRNY